MFVSQRLHRPQAHDDHDVLDSGVLTSQPEAQAQWQVQQYLPQIKLLDVDS
jgi:hypothetical protein